MVAIEGLSGEFLNGDLKKRGKESCDSQGNAVQAEGRASAESWVFPSIACGALFLEQCEQGKGWQMTSERANLGPDHLGPCR